MSVSIITGLRKYVADNLVGGKPVCVDVAQQGLAMPYHVVSLDSSEDYDGLDAQDFTLREETFSFTSYAQTAEAAHDAANAVKAGLVNYSGAMGADRVAESIVIDDGQSGFNQDEMGEDPGRFFKTLSISIQHSPAS